MKKILLGAAGLVVALGMATSAAAADLGVPYTKAPVMIPAIYDWSGFYVGLNGGGGSSHDCWNITNDNITPLGPISPSFREGCHDATGGTVGGQIGYRWQSAAWVFGIEGQGNWADFKGSSVSAYPFPVGMTNETRVNAFGLLTGQVGYSWNNVLWYVKGGAAVTSNEYNGNITAAGVRFDTANESNRWGGTVGTGLEFSFAPDWSVAVEYDHLFMGTRTTNFTSVTAGGPTRMDSISQDVDIGTVRVNYRWGGPVIAKY
jgi:outer membrane immunogenic protein